MTTNGKRPESLDEELATPLERRLRQLPSLMFRAVALVWQAARREFIPTPGRTVVLISHRFASVRLADHVYVLDQGRVIEEGDHASLIKAGGSYAKMSALQAGAFGLHTALEPPAERQRGILRSRSR